MIDRKASIQKLTEIQDDITNPIFDEDESETAFIQHIQCQNVIDALSDENLSDENILELATANDHRLILVFK